MHTTDYPPKPILELQEEKKGISYSSLVFYMLGSLFYFNFDFLLVLLFLLVLIIHELGHFFAMKFYKYSDVQIFFIPFFGAGTVGSIKKRSVKKESIVLLSGPIPGIIIGCILFLINTTIGDQTLGKVSNIFIFLNTLNLLPVLPLDGGRLINILFFDTKNGLKRIFLLISVVLILIYAWDVKSLILFFAAVMLMYQFVMNSKEDKVKRILKEKGFDLNKNYEELTDQEYWLIRDEIGTQSKTMASLISPGFYQISNNEAVVIQEVNKVIYKYPEKDLNVLAKIVIFAIWFIFAFLIPIIV